MSGHPSLNPTIQSACQGKAVVQGAVAMAGQPSLVHRGRELGAGHVVWATRTCSRSDRALRTGAGYRRLQLAIPY